MRPSGRGVVVWLIALIIVATLAIVWSVRETPIAEPTPVILTRAS